MIRVPLVVVPTELQVEEATTVVGKALQREQRGLPTMGPTTTVVGAVGGPAGRSKTAGSMITHMVEVVVVAGMAGGRKVIAIPVAREEEVEKVLTLLKVASQLAKVVSQPREARVLPKEEVAVTVLARELVPVVGVAIAAVTLGVWGLVGQEEVTPSVEHQLVSYCHK